MKYIKRLLVLVLFSGSTLFAHFTTVDCTNQTHLDTLKLQQVECEVLDAFWDAMGNGAGWKDKTNWDTVTYAGDWSGVVMHDDNSSISWLSWPGGNGLSGELPKEIKNFINLEVFNLPSNALRGPLPELPFPNLFFIGLYNNQFTGSIPNSYANLTKLTDLLFDNNQLSGLLPDLSKLTVFDTLRIGANKFTFADIEPQIDYLKDLTDLDYTTNSPINESTHPIVYFNDTVSITPSLAPNPSHHDWYTWKKDNVVLDDNRTYVNNDYSASRIYVKEHATQADEGCYSYDVNNTVLTRPNHGAVYTYLVLHSSPCIHAIYDHAPVISNPPASTVETEAESLYSYTPVASDADGDSLSYSIANTPSWAQFESATGELSGTPGNDDAGEYDINMTVTDGKLPTHINYTLTVTAKDVTPAPDPAPVNNGYTHKNTDNSILTTLTPVLHAQWDSSNQRVFFREHDNCTSTKAAYIALHYQGALFTAFETCSDHSFVETLESTSTYPNGSKATLVPEPNTTQAMIMVEIPLGNGSITIGE